MMDLGQIDTLVDEYHTALMRELSSGEYQEESRIHLLEGFETTGKNADARKRETEEFLMADRDYQVARSSYGADVATRKGHEAKIGLIKAWLYSQSGIG